MPSSSTRFMDSVMKLLFGQTCEWGVWATEVFLGHQLASAGICVQVSYSRTLIISVLCTLTSPGEPLNVQVPSLGLRSVKPEPLRVGPR